MKNIYNQYKERLIEISGRNRSLYLRRITKKYSYDVGEIIENTKTHNDFINFLWQRKSSFPLINDRNVKRYCKKINAQTDKPIDELDFIKKNLTSLKYLKREIEELEKETGRYELFIGYPFIVGTINKDIQIKAPLLLFPTELQIEKNSARLKIIPNQPTFLNKSLILAYAKENGLKTESLMQDFDLANDENLVDINSIINYLNQNNYTIKYQPKSSFLSFKDSEDCCISDELEVANIAILGRFPTANSIYNDYLKLEKNNLSTPSIEMLVKGKSSSKSSKKRMQPIHLTPYAIHDLDYAQENAIRETNANDNIVIYGPPGTGKSQTIVNIISDALCKNKSVLVVSQKKAALDVVFSRLGVLNSKAMLMPNPEKQKTVFFDRIRQMHSHTLSKSYTDKQENYDLNQFNIKKELATLNTINDILFTETSFGLTLQQMYALSYNIGKDSKDYKLYKCMKQTDIINKNYSQLQENINLIQDKKLAYLFYDWIKLVKHNPMAQHIKTDLDMHSLKEAHSFINNQVSSQQKGFELCKYPHGRYLVTFYLENTATSRKSIAYIADIITKIKYPSLARWISLSTLPFLWLLYPLLKVRFNTLSTNIMVDLNVTKHALDLFTEKYSMLKNILTAEGYSLVIGELIYGNTDSLRQLLDTLENYINIRDMHKELSLLSDEINEILYFAYDNSNKSMPSFVGNINKIMPIRIYYEIIKNNNYIEQQLSKTVMFDALRKRILNLKAKQRELAKSLAMDSLSDNYVNYFNNAIDAKDYLYQVQKQRGCWPIRRMVEYFEDYLLRLFPCWLLSPQAVSTIFPLTKQMFDYVIFDEASQIFIEAALPAIYRGHKIIVAGDNKQLRPTSGFVRRYLGDDSFDYNTDLSTQAALEVESLLDLAATKYHQVSLSYHYRSNCAELINFSNTAFYENQLKVAPNLFKTYKSPPIERIKVKGSWLNRCNHQEAVTVVALIKKILNERKNNESIGIVTFNIEQKDHIEDLLDAEVDNSISFRRKYFKELHRIADGENQSIFVKNLENVQGDERDIIIFSIGYARNANDKVIARFGSLSMEGGENRLNVAITRAKKKVYVVTSIEPEELTTVEFSKNNGPKLLKKYLQYARAVSQEKTNEASQILSTFSIQLKSDKKIVAFENEIKVELEKLGYIADTCLGNADYRISVGVYDNKLGRYILGIECDYSAFASSKNALERDIYRIHFLENKGWKIYRVWSRDWWLSREKVLANIVNAIETEKSILLQKMA